MANDVNRTNAEGVRERLLKASLALVSYCERQHEHHGPPRCTPLQTTEVLNEVADLVRSLQAEVERKSELLLEARTVLEYVSRGRRYVDVEPYPDALARRVLGEDVSLPVAGVVPGHCEAGRDASSAHVCRPFGYSTGVPFCAKCGQTL